MNSSAFPSIDYTIDIVNMVINPHFCGTDLELDISVILITDNVLILGFI